MPLRLRKRPFAFHPAVLGALLVLAALSAPAAPGAVRNYDLGPTTLPDRSEEGPLPVRLWGAIGVPSGKGPHPLVVVAHGRHGDNCPRTKDFVFEWPCFSREQRNDLGMRHIVRALAQRGVAAIAPDLNGAYTIGWGEDDDERRWPRIVDATLAAVGAAARGGENRFGLALEGRIDPGRFGVLGHSRSGHNAVRFARASRRVDSLFLLAPVYERVALPDRETTVVLAGCDGDVGQRGRRYLSGAERRRGFRSDMFELKLLRANHNWFNSTLAALGRDDGRFASGPGCRSAERLDPVPQRRWVARVASDFFATTLGGAAAPRWMRSGAEGRNRVAGLETVVSQVLR